MGFDLPRIEARIAELEQEASADGFWSDPARAARVFDSFEKKLGTRTRDLVTRAFLNDSPDKELILLRFLHFAYGQGPRAPWMQGHERVAPVLELEGADLMDGTPVYDIKPYLPYVDSHEEALEGFAGQVKDETLEVVIPEEISRILPEGKEEELREVLALDPRPGYQEDPRRTYGMEFAGMEIRFRVENGVLFVCQAGPAEEKGQQDERE